jgi:hypothetical protein
MGAIFAATLTGLIALFVFKNNINDSLDTKSGWRKELTNVASREVVGFNEVYRLRTALRMSKHYSGFKEVPLSFYSMTNLIIDFVDNLIYTKMNSDKYELNKYEQEIIRIYSRYLLKYHWETRTFSINFFLNKSPQNIPEQYALDTLLQVKYWLEEGCNSMDKGDKQILHLKEPLKNLDDYLGEEYSKLSYEDKSRKRHPFLFISYFILNIIIAYLLSVIYNLISKGIFILYDLDSFIILIIASVFSSIIFFNISSDKRILITYKGKKQVPKEEKEQVPKEEKEQVAKEEKEQVAKEGIEVAREEVRIAKKEVKVAEERALLAEEKLKLAEKD